MTMPLINEKLVKKDFEKNRTKTRFGGIGVGLLLLVNFFFSFCCSCVILDIIFLRVRQCDH